MLSEKLVKQIANDAVNIMLQETSRRQKAQQAIQGKSRRIKTLAIISAQNPMGSDGSDLPSDYNAKSHAELLDTLRNGMFRYFVVKGKYGSDETSVMVYNISLKDTLNLCYRFNQESVIFIDMTNGEKVSYQYWEGKDHNSPLEKQYEESTIINATDDVDFYTQISRKFKFRIPFFEDIQHYLESLNERSKSIDVDRLICECVEDKWSGKHKYFCRGKLHGKVK